MSSKLFSFFQRPLRSSGRKAPAMSQTTVPVVTPTNEPLARLLDAIGQLSQQQRMLFDALKPTYSAPTVPTPAAQAAPLAQHGDLRALVNELFQQHQASASRSQTRDSYVREHLADLPDAYRRLLPESGDALKLAEAEQTIRQQFRDDLKSAMRASGEPATTLGGGQPGGQAPAAAVDYARLSPMQQIAIGLKSASSPASNSRMHSAPRPRAPIEDEYDQEPLFVGAD